MSFTTLTKFEELLQFPHGAVVFMFIYTSLYRWHIEKAHSPSESQSWFKSIMLEN